MNLHRLLTRQMKMINVVKWGDIAIAIVLGILHAHTPSVDTYVWIIPPWW